MQKFIKIENSIISVVDENDESEGIVAPYSDKLLAQIEASKGVKIVICNYWDGDWENEGGHSITEKSLFDCFGLLCEECRWETKSLADWTNMVCSALAEEDYCGFAMRSEDYEEQQKEKRRKELECVASEFAKRCGYAVGTKEYVLSAKKALAAASDAKELAFSGECKAERFAACMFAGCSSSYYEDEGYLSDKYNEPINEMEDVLVWLQENCPLLMLKIAETESEEE